MYYINCYFFFAILGFLFESVTFILLKKPYNSGVLMGPWTPVYGIAFFIILLIRKFLKRWNLEKKIEIILFFLLSILLLSILEFIAGELILIISHVRYWNYVNRPLNIDGFICLEISLLWGIGAIFINYFLYPYIKSFLKKIPKIITTILIILYMIDTIYSTLI